MVIVLVTINVCLNKELVNSKNSLKKVQEVLFTKYAMGLKKKVRLIICICTVSLGELYMGNRAGILPTLLSWSLSKGSMASCFSVSIHYFLSINYFFFYLYQVGQGLCCHTDLNYMLLSGSSWLHSLSFLISKFQKACDDLPSSCFPC